MWIVLVGARLEVEKKEDVVVVGRNPTMSDWIAAMVGVVVNS